VIIDPYSLKAEFAEKKFLMILDGLPNVSFRTGNSCSIDSNSGASACTARWLAFFQTFSHLCVLRAKNKIFSWFRVHRRNMMDCGEIIACSIWSKKQNCLTI